MKSNKRNIMSIIICFLMLADICLTFERRSHNKRATKKRTTLELQNPADKNAIDQNNKMMKFVEGIMTGLKQGNTEWIACIPKSWMNTEGGQQPLGAAVKQQVLLTTADMAKRGNINIDYVKLFNKLTVAAQEIAKHSDKIIEKICPKSDVLQKILTILLQKAKVERRSFIEGTFWTDKHKRKAKNSKKETLKKLWSSYNKSSRILLAKMFKHAKVLKKSLVLFFTSEIFKNIKSMLDCFMTAKGNFEDLRNIILGLKERYSIFATGNLTVPVVVKIIDSLICDPQFNIILNTFIEAKVENNIIKKYHQFGIGVGVALLHLGAEENSNQGQ